MSHEAASDTVGHGHEHPHLEPEKLRVPPGHPLRRVPFVAIIVGAVALVASVALALMGGTSSDGVEAARQFFFSYLVAYMFFLSIGLGGLFFVLIQFAARAGWSVAVRRIAENAMGTLPLLAVLFVPIPFGLHQLFEWSHADAVHEHAVLAGKAPFLNEGFFLVRAVIYLAVWSLMAWWFRRESLRQDETGDERITRRLQFVAGPCIVVYAITVTFAAFDWLMSLSAEWYSTIFGGYYFAGAVIAIHAVMIIVLANLKLTGLVGEAVNVEHFHDLGKMLFAFVVFWAYMGFSQFMLQWYANIPEETSWFGARLHGSWTSVSLILMCGHFLLPFFYLVSRRTKRSRPLLYVGAAWMLVMHYVDLYWLVMPVLHPQGVHVSLLDVTTFLAVGGLVQGTFALLLTRHALLPLRDPRLHESLAFENF